MQATLNARLVLAALALSAAACASTRHEHAGHAHAVGGPGFEVGPEIEAVDDPAREEIGEFVLIEAASGETMTLARVAEALAGYDVVFLGEQHTNTTCHKVQLALTEALLGIRGDVIVSLEQFERDVQEDLDRYLAGELDEDAFLEDARPWPNYADDYRPVIELAKERGLTVLAANVPRRLAARVVREGSRRVLASEWTPRGTLAPPGAYRDRFAAVMGAAEGHGEPGESLLRVFAAQCLKDDAMAESIADALGESPGTLVVHWCGRFHSDAHLGTVERLAWRRPDLSIAVVSMNALSDLTRPLAPDELEEGDFILRVPLTEDEDER